MAACRNIADGRRGSTARQRGVALLVILIIAGVLGVVFVTTVVGGTRDDTERDRITQAALARAKEALIAYAVTYIDEHPDDVPGFLPCPDQGTPASVREGAANGTCGAAYTGAVAGDNALGRLPWYTLNIEPLRDGYGECLWYAVSSTYKNSPEPAMLNWDSEGRFRIMGPDGTTVIAGATNPELVVAVVVAPGPAFGGQVRGTDATAAPNCGGNYTAANYLDTGPGAINNAAPAVSGMATFVQGARTNTFNDRMVFITVRDIWDAVARRTDMMARFTQLTRQVAVCIASYPTSGGSTDRRMPWAVSLSQSGYTLNSQYADTYNLEFGRTPYSATTSDSYTGFSSGNPSPNDHVMLERTSAVGGNGRCSTWNARDDNWWQHWRDHLFYAVSSRFEPNDSPGNNCSSNCLRVNSSSYVYAGIVMFAGRGATMRTTTAQKGNAGNYLYSENTDGDDEYQTPVGTGMYGNAYCINSGSFGGAILVPPWPATTKYWVHPC
jgi:type II secretory pathway pseudopilin PulG